MSLRPILTVNWCLVKETFFFLFLVLKADFNCILMSGKINIYFTKYILYQSLLYLLSLRKTSTSLSYRGERNWVVLTTCNTWNMNRTSLKLDIHNIFVVFGLQNNFDLKDKYWNIQQTLPKAQRTRGLSSSYQSNYLRSYHKFKHKSWSNSSSESRLSINFSAKH